MRGFFEGEPYHLTSRVCNCIRALAALYLPIYPAAIIDAYEVILSLETNFTPIEWSATSIHSNDKLWNVP